MTNDEGNNQSHKYNRNWLLDDVYQTIQPKPKSDVILLKSNSVDARFADASVNRTPFKFLVDTVVSKIVMSLRRFLSTPELCHPGLYNTRMKLQVANVEVISAMCRSCNYKHVWLHF